jgi:hypothetical protein
MVSIAPSRAAGLGCSRQPATRAPTANPVQASSGEAGTPAGFFVSAEVYLLNSSPGTFWGFFLPDRTGGRVCLGVTQGGVAGGSRKAFERHWSDTLQPRHIVERRMW